MVQVAPTRRAPLGTVVLSATPPTYRRSRELEDPEYDKYSHVGVQYDLEQANQIRIEDLPARSTTQLRLAYPQRGSVTIEVDEYGEYSGHRMVRNPSGALERQELDSRTLDQATTVAELTGHRSPAPEFLLIVPDPGTALFDRCANAFLQADPRDRVVVGGEIEIAQDAGQLPADYEYPTAGNVPFDVGQWDVPPWSMPDIYNYATPAEELSGRDRYFPEVEKAASNVAELLGLERHGRSAIETVEAAYVTNDLTADSTALAEQAGAFAEARRQSAIAKQHVSALSNSVVNEVIDVQFALRDLAEVTIGRPEFRHVNAVTTNFLMTDGWRWNERSEIVPQGHPTTDARASRQHRLDREGQRPKRDAVSTSPATRREYAKELGKVITPVDLSTAKARPAEPLAAPEATPTATTRSRSRSGAAPGTPTNTSDALKLGDTVLVGNTQMVNPGPALPNGVKRVRESNHELTALGVVGTRVESGTVSKDLLTGEKAKYQAAVVVITDAKGDKQPVVVRDTPRGLRLFSMRDENGKPTLKESALGSLKDGITKGAKLPIGEITEIALLGKDSDISFTSGTQPKSVESLSSVPKLLQFAAAEESFKGIEAGPKQAVTL
jgi:hypothetical protein